MKINSFAPINFNIIQKKRPSPNNLERVPNCDWVSFTGKSQKPETPYAANAKDFGVKFYHKLLQNMPENINEDDLFATFSENNLEQVIETYQKSDKTDKLLLAMKTGYEYTQLGQNFYPEHKKSIDNIFQGDKRYEKAVNEFSKILLQPFENRYKSVIIENTMNITDRANFFKYGAVVPRPLDTNKEAIYKAFNVKNKQEFEDKVNSEFVQSFKETCPRNYEYGLKLYKDLRKYCAIVARDKAEAYTTESKIAKEILKTDKELNIDILPVYYTMLADTLENFNTKRSR